MKNNMRKSTSRIDMFSKVCKATSEAYGRLDSATRLDVQSHDKNTKFSNNIASFEMFLSMSHISNVTQCYYEAVFLPVHPARECPLTDKRLQEDRRR